MICPNCKHELNPQARVCPTCGTPIPGAPPAGAPTVTVTPPGQAPAQPEKRRATGPRVFVIIFCVLAVLLNALLAWSWFLPAIRVTSGTGVVTHWSMYQICLTAAPYMTYIVCALCAVSAIYCILPLLRCYADRRRRLLVPKLMCLLCALCYSLPYWVTSLVHKVSALISGGSVSHSNLFTTVCLVLFILLCITAELTIWNRQLVQEHQIEDLKEQLTSRGIPPVV